MRLAALAVKTAPKGLAATKPAYAGSQPRRARRAPLLPVLRLCGRGVPGEGLGGRMPPGVVLTASPAIFQRGYQAHFLEEWPHGWAIALAHLHECLSDA
jgi:hypothetical protein